MWELSISARSSLPPLFPPQHIAKVKELIAQTVRARGWLNLYTHDVTMNPRLTAPRPPLLARRSGRRAQGLRILAVRNALGAIAFRPASCRAR